MSYGYSYWYIQEMETKYPFIKNKTLSEKEEFIHRRDNLDIVSRTLYSLHGLSSHSDYLDREDCRYIIREEWKREKLEYAERKKAREERATEKEYKHAEYLERERVREERAAQKQQKHVEYLARQHAREQRAIEKQEKHAEYLERQRVREERAAQKQKKQMEAMKTKTKGMRTIFIKNLSYRTSSENLVNHLSQIGTVESVDILTYPSGESKGLATVVYTSQEEAMKAISTFNGQIFEGRKIIVQMDKYSRSK
jgi:RNA recognition motif-containing protein